jgi:hypothetical protein
LLGEQMTAYGSFLPLAVAPFLHSDCVICRMLPDAVSSGIVGNIKGGSGEY